MNANKFDKLPNLFYHILINFLISPEGNKNIQMWCSHHGTAKNMTRLFPYEHGAVFRAHLSVFRM